MERKITKPDNLFKIAWAYIKANKLKVTRTTLRTAFDTAGSAVNLATLTDAFNQWKIESVAVRIKPDQLASIDFPAIAHLTAEDGLGYFVLLTKYESDQVTYLDSELGYRNESSDDFSLKWQGVVLLTALNPDSGEKEYSKARLQEIQQIVQTWLPILISLYAIGWGVIQPMVWPIKLFAIIKLFGIGVSVALLWEQFGPSNVTLERICQINDQTDCRSVLNSPASKLFGWLGMAEVGLVYFTGGFLTIISSAFGHVQSVVTPLLALLTLTALPYTLFSVYYQGWVIKKWCVLCLGVQVLLWLEFSAVWPLVSMPFAITGATIGLLLLCFCAPLVIWLYIKQIIELANRVTTLTNDLARFQESTDVFEGLLESEPAYDMQFKSKEIIVGAITAPVTLTMVSGPFCSPCAKAHQTVADLLAQHPDELRIVIRFAVEGRDASDVRNQMAQHFIDLADQEPGLLPSALDYWYETTNIEQLKSRFPVQTSKFSAALLSETSNWNQTVGIQYTPTFFINNHLLPKPFTVNDLRYHIRNMADRQSLSIANQIDANFRAT